MTRAVVLPVIIFILYLSTNIFGAEIKLKGYERGADVPVQIDTIGPRNNLLEFYKYQEFPLCQANEVGLSVGGLGELILGYKLAKAPFTVNFGISKISRLCDISLNETNYNTLKKAVINDYQYNIFIDELPVWIPVGKVGEEEEIFLYTFLEFTVSKNQNKVVEVNVEAGEPIHLVPGSKLAFSYSVEWTSSEIQFNQRFDKYLQTSLFHLKIRQFAVYNNLFIIIFVTFAVYVVSKFISGREDVLLGEKEKFQKDIPNYFENWRKIRSDLVFQPPSKMELFSAILGNGYQLILTLFIVLLLGFVGLKYYSKQGTILTCGIVLFMLFSLCGGCLSAAYYLRNKGKYWQKTYLYTIGIISGAFFSFLLLSHVIAVLFNSGGQFSVSLICALLVIFLVNCVLVLIGTLIGRFKEKLHIPNTKDAKDSIHTQSNFFAIQNLIPLVLCGFPPFLSIFVELHNFFADIWLDWYYFRYGYAIFTFLCYCWIVGGFNIIYLVFTLNNLSYNWQWRSFEFGCVIGVYFMIYSYYFYFFATSMNGLYQFIQFSFCSLFVAFCIVIITTPIGFQSSRYFLRKIMKMKK